MTEIIGNQTFSSGSNLQTNITKESFDELTEEVSKLKNELTEAKNNFEKSRFDLITLLGVFVGLITYLGVEI